MLFSSSPCLWKRLPPECAWNEEDPKFGPQQPPLKGSKVEGDVKLRVDNTGLDGPMQ